MCGYHHNFHRQLPDAPPSPSLLALPSPPCPQTLAPMAAPHLWHGRRQRGEEAAEADRMHCGGHDGNEEDLDDFGETSNYDNNHPALLVERLIYTSR
ncbi:hypothetical protein GUJ93_ZPchr0006g45640 [Zizania palustris]|uniref:Uncharacterized protein n=1 Tax=Zizania palustris TaxID=103762 RepID=A0A8J5W3U3_ZIZPA|nr:hypothetical protein GUJ93_ZPchr0006g45640 [Zizania palustris]